MKKRLCGAWTAVLLSLSMLLACLPLTALASGDAKSVGTWADLKEAMRTGGDIVLTADVKDPATKAPDTDNGYLLVPEGAAVTLDLAGHAVDRAMGDIKGDWEKGVVIRVERDASLTIKDSSGNDSGKITGGYSGLAGGIWVDHGTLVLDGGSITGNRLEDFGPAVRMDGGSFTMNGGIISDNSADRGTGGVCLRYDAVFTMNGGSITGNTGNEGGGVNIDRECNFTMNDGKISGNTTTGSGGGIINRDGNFTMNGGEISGNTTPGAGGGIIGNGVFTMNGGEISGNTSGFDGGGVRIRGDFTMTDGRITGNSASAAAGGVASSGTFTMSGGEISGNTSGLDGGGVWLDSCEFTLSDGKISNNTSNRNGGGMACQGSPDTITISGGEISNNTAARNGGGIHAQGWQETITISGGKISGNRATGELNPDDKNIGRGGGVYSYHILNMSGGEISGNTAKNDGGGVYYEVRDGRDTDNGREESAMSLSGTAAIKGNAARNGGGVYFEDPFHAPFDFTMSGGEISGNAATENGGGVYALHSWNNYSENPSPFPMLLSGGAIKNNQAKNGGGVYNAGNYRYSNAGEFSNDDPKVTLTVTGGEISGNKATENGGGVFGAGYEPDNRDTSNFDSAVFVMSGGRVADNSAANGGGVYHEAGNVTLSGGAVTGNAATEKGGGVFAVSDTLTVSGPASVTGNQGGNVYLKDKNLIRVGGKLDGASVGVSTDDPEGRGIFTASYKSAGNAENPASAFLSDNDLYTADFSADGNEAQLYRTIRKQDIALSDADGKPVTSSTYVYDGAAKTPAVKATWSGETLVENTDYTVSYSDNVNASGAACVTITGKGAYRGAVTVNFTIAKAPIAPTVALDGWTYGETAKTPSVAGNPGNGSVIYSYAPAGSASFSASVPTNAGTYAVKAVVAETDNYQSGEASAEFAIAKAQIAPSVTLDGWAFGAAPNAPVVAGNPGNGAVTYSYAPAGSGDFSATVPTQPGTYAVKAVVAESANYQGGEAFGDFAIEPLAVKKVALDGGKVTAEVVCGLSDASVYCAVYDASGAMIAMSVKPVSGADAYEFQFDGAAFDYAKVFLLDADLNPLCEAKRS